MVQKLPRTESLTDLIMATLGSARNTRLFRSILLERKLKRYQKESVRVALYRLRSKGYIGNSKLGWLTTKKGKNYINNVNMLSFIPSPFKKNHSQNIVISFDIPEKDRKVRNWLRNQLKIFGYKMLQQSLWIGPGPFPSSFIRRLENLDIRRYIKTFRVKNRSNV